jgi:hypothetical protein
MRVAMRSDAATTIRPAGATTAAYRILRRPSATFLVLAPTSAEGPEPGAYAGEVTIGGTSAPCGITVLEEPAGQVWCRPRGPLPLVAVGDEAIVWFEPRSTGGR